MDEMRESDRSTFDDQKTSKTFTFLGKSWPHWLKFVLPLLIILTSIAIWLFVISRDKAVAPAERVETETQTSEQQAAAIKEHPSEMVYAYKEKKTTKVRSFKWSDKSKQTIFEYEESVAYEPQTNNYFSALGASVDYNPASQTFVLIDNGGMKLIDRQTKGETSLISKVSNFSSDSSPPDWSIEFESVSGPSVYEIFTPNFSPDASLVSYRRGHYEGSSVGILDAESKSDRQLGDTFTYVEDNSADKISFEYAEGNELFRTIRQYGEHYLNVKGADVHSSAISPDGAYAAFILDPLPSPQSPTGVLKLVIVELNSLQFKVLDESAYYSDSLVFSPDSQYLYIVNSSASVNDFSIEKWSMGSESLVTSYKIQQGFAVGGSYDHVTLYSFDTVYAAIKTKLGSEYDVFVVDVDKQKQLAYFLVDKVSDFSILFAKQ